MLQTLNPQHLLGGRMKIRQDLAEAAIGRLAERLGMGVMETAQGILSVVTANMARAIRVISVQRGHDPRDYTLMAFGGAGPLHAARLARELEIGRVLVPRNPGILCAMGLLLTDLRADFAATRLVALRTRPSAPIVAEAFAGLAERAEALVRAGGHRAADRRGSRAPSTCATTARTTSSPSRCPTARSRRRRIEALAAGFAEAHRQRYGFVAEGDPVEIVTLRLEAIGAGAQGRAQSRIPKRGRMRRRRSSAAARSGCRRPGISSTTPIYDRERLKPGNRFAGPAIVEQMDATTLVPPGMTARVDRWLNLILEAA